MIILLSNIEFKNEWSYNSAAAVCRNGVYRETFSSLSSSFYKRKIYRQIKSSLLLAESENRQVENKINIQKTGTFTYLLCLQNTVFSGGEYRCSCFIDCDAVYPCRKLPVLRRNDLLQQRFLRKACQFLSYYEASHFTR